MALSFVNSHYVAGEWLVNNVRTMSVDAGAGTQRVLVTVVTTDRWKDTAFFTSVTYGGVAMTAGPVHQYDNCLLRLYYLYGPAGGTNNLVVTCADSTGKVGCFGAVYDGMTATAVANASVTRGPVNWSAISAQQTAAAGQYAVVMAWRELQSGVTYTSGTLTERLDNASRYVADILSSGPTATLAFSSTPNSGGAYFTFALDVAGGIQVKKVYARLVNASGAPQTNLTGIRYAYWDVTTPDAIAGAPLHSGTAETTDVNGMIEVLVPNSAKANNETGFLVLSNTTGSVSQTPAASCFAGPVIVTVTTE